MARNQSETLGGFREILGHRLGAAAYSSVGTGFRAGTASESIRRTARKNRAPCLSLGASSIGAAKRIVSRFTDYSSSQQSHPWQSTSQYSASPSRGAATSRREFQKSNLAIELRAGKKRLKEALRGLIASQCQTAGATRKVVSAVIC